MSSDAYIKVLMVRHGVCKRDEIADATDPLCYIEQLEELVKITQSRMDGLDESLHYERTRPTPARIIFASNRIALIKHHVLTADRAESLSLPPPPYRELLDLIAQLPDDLDEEP